MSIFISAGHNGKGIKPKYDSGAVSGNVIEGLLTIDFRDLVVAELKKLGVTNIITDYDTESLGDYLLRIKTGNGSVICEYHFDSAIPVASGTTAIVEQEADRLDRAFAKEIVDSTALTLGIKNRGVISEGDSHRGRLGLMREEGIICLCELAFVSNPNDVAAYHRGKATLARIHAGIIKKYEDML